MARKTIFFCPNARGGKGDALMAIPALEKIKTIYPDSAIYCQYKYWRLFKHQPLFEGFAEEPEGVLETPRSEYRRIVNQFDGPESIVYPDCFPPLDKTTPHAINFICRRLGLGDTQEKINFQMAQEDIAWARETTHQLERKIFLLHQPCPVTRCGNCSLRRGWYNDRWAEVAQWLAGKDYAVIQLGLVFEQPIAGAIGFLGRTSTLQALALFRFAHGFVGVDSLFNHATNIGNLPGVVLFGATTPKIWGYKHNINIYKGLECSPCFDRRRLKQECPERNCMKLISADEVIEALNQILD